MNKDYIWEKCGEIIQNALDDPAVNEIMLNPDENLWIKKFNQPTQIQGQMSFYHAMGLVQAVAHYAGLYLNVQNPSLVCSLPFNNERISICIPPMTQGVSFNIRKPSLKVMSLQNYENDSILSPVQARYLKKSILEKKNILVSGGPGSGKTTLGNALLKQIADDLPKGHHILILEDTYELQCQVTHHLAMKTSEARSMRDLLKQALRSAPDAIVVGEVVDGAALDLLKAWNVGCPGGLATIHANSAVASLQRLEDLTLEVALTPPKNLIGDAVDIIIHIKVDPHHPAGRVVTQVLEVSHFDLKNDCYITTNIC